MRAIGHPEAKGAVRAWLSLVVERLRASPWAGPAGKVLLAALALGVLSAIGGSALAGVSSVESQRTTGPPDAHAAPLPAPSTSPTVLAETVIAVPPTDGGASATPPGAPSGKATAESPVGLNTATAEELRRLPGIGPKKAEAILALRAKLGRFHRPEELMRVKGIGRGTFKKLRPLVRVDEPTK